MEWLDGPVKNIIDYFNGMTANFLNVALQLAVITFLLGIIWSCIQVAFGTMEVRKMWVGTITKFFGFILVMALFPSFSRGLETFAFQASTSASGNAVSQITTSLANFMGDLEKLSKNETADYDKLIEDQKALITTNQAALNSAKNSYRGGYNYNGVIKKNIANAQEEIAALDAKKEKLKNSSFLAKQIKAIQSVLVMDDGTNIAPKYALNLTMDGTSYLSPSAIARITLLAGDIMWNNEWIYDVVANSTGKDEDVSDETAREAFKDAYLNGKKKIKFLDFSVFAFFRAMLVAISVVFMLCCTVACLIQYVMAIIEFAVSSSFCIILVPCMLFDMLKDTASKILATLLSQTVKLCMITICMYFNVFIYLNMAMTNITTNTEFGFSDFVSILFTSFLTFTLVANAPKLAATIMTGQPQMSMGEFLQTGAAAVAGGRAAVAGAHMAAGAVRSVANQGANRLGDAAAMIGRGSAATKDAGGFEGGLKSAGAFLKGAGAEGLARTGKRIQAKASGFMHGGKGGGGGRGGGGNDTSNITQAGGKLKTGDAGQANLTGRGKGNTNEVKDAQGNAINSKFADTAAMNYRDAKNNNGEGYSGNMSFGDFLKTQFNAGSANYQRKHKKSSGNPPDGGGHGNNLPSVPGGGGGGGNHPIYPKGGSPKGLPPTGLPPPSSYNNGDMVPELPAMRKMAPGTHQNVFNKDGAEDAVFTVHRK